MSKTPHLDEMIREHGGEFLKDLALDFSQFMGDSRRDDEDSVKNVEQLKEVFAIFLDVAEANLSDMEDEDE